MSGFSWKVKKLRWTGVSTARLTEALLLKPAGVGSNLSTRFNGNKIYVSVTLSTSAL
jgi:hypothetical protein